MMFPFPLDCGPVAEPGSQDYTDNGSVSFVVPLYNTITFTLLGAGGEGGPSGQHGGDTTIAALSLTAVGGRGAASLAGGVGGAATGIGASPGNAGTNGASGSVTGSGTYPSMTTGRGGHSLMTGTGGGAAKTGASNQVGNNATENGAGGGGGIVVYFKPAGSEGGKGGNSWPNTWSTDAYAGGGGGARKVSTFNAGDAGAPAPGAALAIVVGKGGANNATGGNGGDGRVLIEWS